MIAPGDSQADQPPEPDPQPDDPAAETICHVSSDGLLALTIVQDLDGEPLLGFHGFDWHIEASQLASDSQLDMPSAVAAYVNAILDDQAIIALLMEGGEITDAWITDDPDSDREHLSSGEDLVFRYWSGRAVQQ